jgi:hypothetical protein
MSGKRTKLFFALGIISPVVLLMIWLIPDRNTVRLSPLAANAPCADVLLQLDDATTAWAEANKMDTLAQPDAEKLKRYFEVKMTPACPRGGKITFGTLAIATTCSLHGHAVDKRPVKQPKQPPAPIRFLRDVLSPRARTNSNRTNCIGNLRQIDGAKQQWALENKTQNHECPTATDIALYLKNSQIPLCPHRSGHGKYILNAVGTVPQCTRAAVGHTL